MIRSKASTNPPQNIGGGLEEAVRMLSGHIPSPLTEAEVILRHVLGTTRSQIYGRAREPLAKGVWQEIESMISRRVGGEPLQYITGVQSFRRIELAVGPGVLIPRPETEMVVGMAIERIAGIPSPKVLDLCTGSGAIALSIATEVPHSLVVATDISAEALAWAKKNRSRLRASNVELLHGELFEPVDDALRGGFDLVVANPPYVAEVESALMDREVRDFEPKIATISGETGMEISRRIVEGAPAWLRPGGWLVLETSASQWPNLEPLMRDRLSDVRCDPDLAGIPRIASGRR